ncbi:MAG: DUF59 domain-containing protein [Deltaproteobacteria bacterium]|nr:MAG: DUF59 domain-containing protein [Deltaproteobacteria bacterium]
MIPGREEIIDILKRVKDPETEMSVFDLGLVRSVDFNEVTGKLIINIDFRRRNPSCAGCVPIAWLVQKKITENLAEEFMKFGGIKSVEFIDK